MEKAEPNKNCPNEDRDPTTHRELEDVKPPKFASSLTLRELPSETVFIALKTPPTLTASYAEKLLPSLAQDCKERVLAMIVKSKIETCPPNLLEQRVES